MNDETLETIKQNPDIYTKTMLNNPDSNQWLIEEFKNPFVLKKFTVPDFEFIIDEKMNKIELTQINSELLHKSLEKLPAYILSDERFWAWINFDKGYQLSQILIPLKENSSRLKNHYFFGSGKNRRGMFFGVLSRLFFRAYITYDINSGDPYELTKYVNENPSRFRNLTWRTYSNDFELVKKILKIQYRLELLYKDGINTHVYEEIAKYISQIGSLTYVEMLSEEELEVLISNKVKKIIASNELKV